MNTKHVEKHLDSIKSAGNISEHLNELHNTFVHFIPLEHLTPKIQTALYYLCQTSQDIKAIEEDFRIEIKEEFQQK